IGLIAGPVLGVLNRARSVNPVCYNRFLFEDASPQGEWNGNHSDTNDRDSGSEEGTHYPHSDRGVKSKRDHDAAESGPRWSTRGRGGRRLLRLLLLDAVREQRRYDG